MKVLVCGGRGFLDKKRGYAELDTIHDETPITLVIEGGASGADYIAKRWAEDRGVPCKEYAADWNRHGRAAGPLRNEQMLVDGRPDCVLALPGGRGTADMVRRARAAMVPVIEVSK